jgi:hypothetical protein
MLQWCGYTKWGDVVTALEKELEKLVNEVAPPILDLEELERLVAIDESPDTFDGECTIHHGCLSVHDRLT